MLQDPHLNAGPGSQISNPEGFAGVSKPQKKAPESSSRRQSEAGTAKKPQQEPQAGSKGKAGQVCAAAGAACPVVHRFTDRQQGQRRAVAHSK